MWHPSYYSCYNPGGWYRHEWKNGRIVITTNLTYLGDPWSFVTQIRILRKPSHGGDRKAFRSYYFHLTTSNPWFNTLLVSSNSLSRKSWYIRNYFTLLNNCSALNINRRLWKIMRIPCIFISGHVFIN
jgi:hypothetical protein